MISAKGLNVLDSPYPTFVIDYTYWKTSFHIYDHMDLQLYGITAMFKKKSKET